MITISTSMYRTGGSVGMARVRTNPFGASGTWQIIATHAPFGTGTTGSVSTKPSARPLGAST